MQAENKEKGFMDLPIIACKLVKKNKVFRALKFADIVVIAELATQDEKGKIQTWSKVFIKDCKVASTIEKRLHWRPKTEKWFGTSIYSSIMLNYTGVMRMLEQRCKYQKKEAWLSDFSFTNV